MYFTRAHCLRHAAAIIRFLPGLLIAVTLCGTHHAVAQESGTLRGKVVLDGTAKAVVGAVVRIKDTQLETESGAGGQFVLRGVPSGAQTLVVDYIGALHFEDSITINIGESLSRTLKLRSREAAMEQVIVRGRATGRTRALNMQRAAMNVVNVVSADNIGNFPDQNVAEALSRVPGISIVRNRGEGRYVNIRGIDAELNAYSVDGLSLASPRGDERAIALDIIPTDVVERLEVSKTLLPDQPADAIGGAVNVISQSAFDHDGPVAQVTLQSNYSDYSDEWQPHIDGAFGNLFGARERLGLLVAFSQDRRHIGTDRTEARNWSLEEDPSTGNEYYLPDRIRDSSYDVDRERTGATVNLEYRADDNSLYFARGVHNKFTDRGVRHRAAFELDAAGLEGLSNDGAIVNIGDVEQFGETEVKQEVRDRYEELSISGIQTGGQNRVGDMLLDYQLGYSFAEEYNEYRFRSVYVLSDPTQVALTGTAGSLPDVEFTGVGADPTDPGNYQFDGIRDDPFRVEEDHWELAFNARWNLGMESHSFWKSGFRARWKDKQSEFEVVESDANPVSVEILDQITAGTGLRPYNGSVPLVDPRIRDVFYQQFDEFDVQRSFSDATVGDWQSHEDVYAAYLMGGRSFGKLEMQGGVRFERTEFQTRGFSVDEEAGTASAVSADNNYNEWLPNVHAEYKLLDNVLVRAAYTQTVSRPAFEFSSSARLIDGDEIERGNPELDRSQSRNFDLALDAYLTDTLGLISIAGFYKEVDGYVFSRVFSEEIGGEQFEVTSYENGDSGEIYGLELAYQQELSFLPSPFNGLGIQSNVVFVHSKATLPVSEDRETLDERRIRFPRQSDRVANLALTYEKGDLFLRLAATHQGAYLVSVGDVLGEDIFAEERVHWDITSRYTFSDQWRVFANFSNVTNEPEGQRFRQTDRLANYERHSWLFQVGFDFRM